MTSLGELRQELRAVAQEALEFEEQAKQNQAIGARAVRCLSALLGHALKSCRLEEAYRELLSCVAALNAGLLAPGRVDIQNLLEELGESHSEVDASRAQVLRDVGELLPDLEACDIRKQDVERALLALGSAEISSDVLFSDALQADLPLVKGRRVFLQPGDIFTRSQEGGLEQTGGQNAAPTPASEPRPSPGETRPADPEFEILRLREQNAELQKNLSLTLTALASKQPAFEVADLDTSDSRVQKQLRPQAQAYQAYPQPRGFSASQSPSRGPASPGSAYHAASVIDPDLERELRQTCKRVSELQGALQDLRLRVTEQTSLQAATREAAQSAARAAAQAAQVSQEAAQRPRRPSDAGPPPLSPEALAASVSSSLSVSLLEDLPTRLASRVSEQLSGPLANQLASQLTGQLTGQLTNQLTAQLPGQLAAQLEGRLAEHLAEYLTGQLSRSLGANLSESLSQQLSDHIGLHLESSLRHLDSTRGPPEDAGALADRLAEAVRVAVSAGNTSLKDAVRTSLGTSARDLAAALSPAVEEAARTAVAAAVQQSIRLELPEAIAPLLASGSRESAPLAELHRALGTVESSLRQEKERSAALNAEIDDLRRKNASLESSLAQAKSGGTASPSMLQRLSALFGDVTMASAALSEAISEARARKAADGPGPVPPTRAPLSTKIFVLTSLEDVENSLLELSGPDSGDGLRELSSQLAATVRELLDAEDARTAAVARLEDALGAERDRCARLEKELASGSLEASQTADKALRDATERASAATKEASDLRMQLAERDAQLGVEQSQASACREKLEAASSENAALTKRVSELQARFHQAASLLVALRKDVNESSDSAATLQLSINTLSTQLGSLRQEYSESDAQLGEVWSTVESVRGIVRAVDPSAVPGKTVSGSKASFDGAKPIELSPALQKGLRDLLQLLEVSVSDLVSSPSAWCSLVSEGQEKIRGLQLEVQNSTSHLVRLLSQQKENEDLAKRALAQSRGLGERVSELSAVCTRLLQERQ